MAASKDDIKLVRDAIIRHVRDGYHSCIAWESRLPICVFEDVGCESVPLFLEHLCEHLEAGGRVHRRLETRDEYKQYDFYYEVFPHFEGKPYYAYFRLKHDQQPVVWLCSAHWPKYPEPKDDDSAL